MPNYRTHLAAGTIAGTVTAGVLSQGQPSATAFAEITGGLLGGAIGGIMPDVIEPATSPNHRKIAHSMVAAGSLALARVTEWQAACRRRAAEHSQAASLLQPGCQERADAESAAMWWSLLAGFTAGFVAGYASHLALDALTTRSLPLTGI
jgi:membrane-bound metal-dependent hydrolase YbcI (DUF457 family)